MIERAINKEFERREIKDKSENEDQSIAPIGNDEVGANERSEMSASLQWSKERAKNGEPFLIGKNGSIDLVNIPQGVFDKMGINKAPFRLTPSMVAHVYERHKRELHLNSLEDAVQAILDVMTNFDRVRQGRENTYIFSVEGTRNESARRAVTIVLEYDKGEWLGIKTVGYDRITNLKELPILWEKGEKNSSTTGVAPANVTSDQSSRGDQTDDIASNQSTGFSTNKGNTSISDKQDVDAESSEEIENTETSNEDAEPNADENPSDNHILYRDAEGSLEQINDRFNAQIEQYIRGELPVGKIIELGNPMGAMQLFLSNKPIVMRPRILRKASETKHNISLEELFNLPQKLSEPIFVFKRNNDTIGVLTELNDRDGKKTRARIKALLVVYILQS